MRRILLATTVAAVVALLLLPASAFAALTNEYGMKYAGQEVCVSCHEVTYGETTHGEFAKFGADPSDPSMWPAGKSVGEKLEMDQIGFTLGGGTGLREYLAISEPSVVSVSFTAVEGASPSAMSVAASKAGFTSASAVVVATGLNFPDALGGAALAGAVNGPLLLLDSAASVPTSVLDEITRLGATDIYVLGKTPSVSANAETQLAAKGTVTRLGGDSRYITGSLVASEAVTQMSSFGGKVFVATGAKFADAIAAGPVAYKLGMPIVLVNPAKPTEFTLPTGTTSAVILGDGTSVLPATETKLNTLLTDAKVDRLAGNDRFDTAARVAQLGVDNGMKWDGFGIANASGTLFSDALASATMLGAKNSVMLTTGSSLSSYANAKIAGNKASINKGYFCGTTLISSTRSAVAALLPDKVTPATNPFFVPSMEWDPIAPDTWEIGSTGIEAETYTCQPCHHLGATSAGKKPTVGNFVSTSVTGTANAWVTDPNSTEGSPDKYVAGSSIQCEVCHGTGTPAGTAGNHFGNYTSNVKILRGTELLDSQVCGQCHGTPKSKSMFGYTPDQNINIFATWNKMTDVPTETSFTANPAGYKFFPNGQNKGNKHSYYTEWTMSGHSYRGALTKDDPRASVYQAAGNGHYNAKTSSLDCAKCHTGEGYAKRKSFKIMQNITLTNDNVGNYGQECATCHMPHKAGTENGMDVRKPDTAVTYAGITMTSICEDCHNWQLEMTTGASIPTTFSTPAKDLTKRGGYSHPTREIYNGRGMFEIAAADKFMPDVKCEECHMPATKSDFPDKTGRGRYEQRSYKRYSHRMFIMEPGKAADWGLAAFGDSCSPCHAGQTQDQLQGFIEKWQDEAADAAVEASAAYVAAYTQAEGGASEGTNTAAFKALMGPAYYNYRNYLGEGSMGAHNPDYIVAGLNKATQLAKSVNGSFKFVGGGSAFAGANYVVGTVVNGDGSGAANAKLVIDFANGADQTVYTDANGNFAATFVDTDSVNSITWKRCSDPAADITPAP